MKKYLLTLALVVITLLANAIHYSHYATYNHAVYHHGHYHGGGTSANKVLIAVYLAVIVFCIPGWIMYFVNKKKRGNSIVDHNLYTALAVFLSVGTTCFFIFGLLISLIYLAL